MSNLNKLRRYLKSSEYDGIILGRRDNYKWITEENNNEILTSTEVGVAYLIVLEKELLLVADSSDCERMKEEQNALGAKCIVVPWSEGPISYISNYAQNKILASDTDIDGTINIQEDLITLRMTLNQMEVKRYREIGVLMACVVENVISEARPGDTEKQVATRLKAECIEEGVSPDCVLVGSDERLLKYRHPMPTDKRIEKTLMVVLGGEKYGLNISLTRIICFSEIPNDYKVKMEKVQHVFAYMQTMMKGGLSYSEYFNKVKDLYREVGYKDEWLEHHQGGPTGYACREVVVSDATKGSIENGVAFAWNPTLQGTKCEETTFLSDDKVEILTNTKSWPRRTVNTPYGELDVAEIRIVK
ncbi:MAG: M24 family metallopeptidase [Suipraeoptans sp.]